MKLIFLDVDGVLNGHQSHPRTRYCSVDRACAERLDRILEVTGAHLVLTSSWRYLVHSGSMTLDGLRNLLYTHWIDGSKLLGVTRRDVRDSLGGYPMDQCCTDRGPQISDWLAAWVIGMPYLQSVPYVVLDDLDLEITACGHPFVQTDGSVGLTDQDADMAIGILTGAEA